MKDSANKYYVLKLWITSIIVSILIFIIATIIKSKNFDGGFLGFGIFMFFYSAIISFPTFVTVFLISKFGLTNLNSKNRFLLAGISIIIILFSIYLIFGSDKYNLNENFSALSFSIISTLSIIISTYILKIKNYNIK